MTTSRSNTYDWDLIAHADPTVRERVGEEEWAVRVDLAACYRLIARYGWTDMIYNHISARVPGSHDKFLINAFGLLYEEVCASNLVTVDVEGNVLDGPKSGANPAGFIIHSAIHQARHDAACVLHTHSKAGSRRVRPASRPAQHQSARHAVPRPPCLSRLRGHCAGRGCAGQAGQ